MRALFIFIQNVPVSCRDYFYAQINGRGESHMQINWGTFATLIGMIGVVSGVMLGWMGRSRSSKQDTVQQASSGAALRADVDYIKRGVDDTRIEIKAQGQLYNMLSERVTRLEESSKQAHKRLDRLDRKEE